MKSKIIFIAAVLILVAGTGNAQVPQLINYQGMLTDNTGTNVNTIRAIQFLIYDAENGGTVLWSETQNVIVTNGLFNVLLGTVTLIPHNVFDGGNRYFTLKVGTDAEMTPRKRLVSVGYAFHAHNSDRLGGYQGDLFVRRLDGIKPLDGNIDLIEGSNITINKDEANHSITISASGGGGGLSLPYTGSTASSAIAFSVTTTGTGQAGSFKVDNSGSTASALRVTNSGTGFGIEAQAASSYAIRATSSGESGYGVYGLANGANARGLVGSSTGENGRGVWGSATGANGHGVYGSSSGLNGFGLVGSASGYAGRGVYGEATNTESYTGVNYGGYFFASGRNESLHRSIGVHGECNTQHGKGVNGKADGESGIGVIGVAGGILGTGVMGIASNTGNYRCTGGNFSSDSKKGIGAFGGTYGSEGVGVYGYALHSSATAVYAEGDLVVTKAYRGNLGPNKGAPFPRPAYDSGWLSIAQGATKVLNHAIGGNPDDYVVDLQFKKSDGEVHQHLYGGIQFVSGLTSLTYGASWGRLTANEIRVYRKTNDEIVDFIRVRIWVIN